MIQWLKKKLSPSMSLSSEQVKQYYNDWHERYLESFGNVFQSARFDEDAKLFEHILHKLNAKDGDKVLDAGCGVGGPAIGFCNLINLKVWGVTVSEKQVVTAVKNIESAKLSDRINIRVGDFHFLDQLYQNEEFDRAVFLESLVHSNHPEIVIESLTKVLKKGAYVYIKDLFTRQDFEEWERERIETAVRNTNKFCQLNIKPVSQITRLLEKNGFIITEMNNMDYANHEIGNAFVIKNGLDIYERQEPIIYLDWMEIVARKN